MRDNKKIVQRFSTQFHNEIDCEDKEETIRNIITLINKCGLKELLGETVQEDQKPTVSNKKQSGKKSLNNSPNSSNSTRSTKKINGYNLFIKEKLLGSKESLADAAGMWRDLSDSEKMEYRERARNY